MVYDEIEDLFFFREKRQYFFVFNDTNQMNIESFLWILFMR